MTKQRGGYSDGASYVMDNYGPGQLQYSRVFDMNAGPTPFGNEIIKLTSPPATVQALIPKGGRRRTRRHKKRAHKKSAKKSHRKSARKGRKGRKSRRHRRGGLLGMFKKDPPCPSPGQTAIRIGAYNSSGIYSGAMQVGDKVTGVSRNQTKTRLCMANGQGKWVSDDGKHTLQGTWKNNVFQGRIPNPTVWSDKAGNKCPGPHCSQPTPP